MDQKKLVHIQTFTQKFTNDPSQKFLLMILCSQAKLENDNKSLNVKRGLRARVEQGLWPSTAPTGYLNSRDRTKVAQVELDPDRSKIIKSVFEHIGYDNWSGMKTYNWLTNELKFRTHRGKVLSKGNFYLMIRSTFYYGVFEYPIKSGNWYNGAHTPLISKELHGLVQENISSKSSPSRRGDRPRTEARYGSRRAVGARLRKTHRTHPHRPNLRYPNPLHRYPARAQKQRRSFLRRRLRTRDQRPGNLPRLQRAQRPRRAGRQLRPSGRRQG